MRVRSLLYHVSIGYGNTLVIMFVRAVCSVILKQPNHIESVVMGVVFPSIISCQVEQLKHAP